MTIINFDKNGNKGQGGSTSGDYQNATVATIYVCRQKKIPAWASKYAFYYAEDVKILYRGQGPNRDLEVVSDLLRLEQFPTEGVEEKLYLIHGVLYYWSKESGSYCPIGKSTGDVPITPTKIIECQTRDDLPVSGVAGTLYIIVGDGTNSELLRYDAALKTFVDFIPDTTQELKNIKEALALKEDKSAVNVLSEKLKEIEQKIPEPFDDSLLKQLIASLEDRKADKTALVNLVTETELLNTVDQAKTDLHTEIAKKADKTTLDAYRPKVDKIQKSDLDQALLDELEAGAAYDDTEIKNDIINLQNNKSDKTALDNFLSKDEKITESNLSDALKDKLNQSFDDTTINNSLAALETNKADKAALDEAKEQIKQLQAEMAKKNIVSIAAITGKQVANGTQFAALNLPSTIEVVLHTGEKKVIPVIWQQGSYDANASGTYDILGVLTLPDDIKNLGDFTPKISIKVEAPIVGDDGCFDLRFEMPELATVIKVTDIPGWKASYEITGEDFYGPEFDGVGKRVNTYWIGYRNNEIHAPSGVYHPIETDSPEVIAAKKSPDGELAYDPDTKNLTFAGGSSATRIYRIVKTI